MENRRLYYNTNYIRLDKRNVYIDFSEMNYLEYDKKTVLVDKNITVNLSQLNHKGKSYKMKDLRWLSKQKAFYSNCNIVPTLSQYKELKRCIDAINNGEFMKIENLGLFVSEGHKNKYLERQRFILNSKKSNGLLASIVRFGISKGIALQVKGFKKGKDNIAYNHKGKYSPLSEKFIHYKGLSDGEIEKQKKNISDKIRESNRENGNNDTTISYWLKHTNSKEEAIEKLKERQSTFSLEKCIVKHGEEQGQIVFNKRQQKWQDTLNAKSEEEKLRINQLKSTGRMHQLFSSNPIVKEVPGILYYIRFHNSDFEFWKIGITSKTINERFGTENNFLAKNKLHRDIIFTKTDMSFYECFKAEQFILTKYKSSRITVKHNFFSSTECFSEDVLKDYECM